MQLIVDQPPISTDTDAGVNGAGRTLFGYEVISLLGEGAEAAVYAVMHPETKQIYALKHVIKKDAKHQRFIDQLYNEYNVGKQVKHPNVRQVIELKATRSMLLSVTEAALVMELLDATPLDKLIEQYASQGQAVPLTWSLGVMVQAARGLAAVNSAGLVHCDIKPSNIMVPDDRATGVVKVIDLGQACAAGTAKKRIQGSPHFISPEQFKLQPVTFRTDVFNFGATLYWVVTGHHVPTAYTNAKGMTKTSTEKAKAPAQLRGDVSRDLSELVMECLRTNPTERPDTMSAVANRLGLIMRAEERNAAVA